MGRQRILGSATTVTTGNTGMTLKLGESTQPQADRNQVGRGGQRQAESKAGDLSRGLACSEMWCSSEQHVTRDETRRCRVENGDRAGLTFTAAAGRSRRSGP